MFPGHDYNFPLSWPKERERKEEKAASIIFCADDKNSKPSTFHTSTDRAEVNAKISKHLFMHKRD